MTHIILCPNCATNNPEGSKFCNNCGTKLPPPDKIACMNCGTLNSRNVVYCDNCGARLETGKLPEPETPETEQQPRSSLSNKIFSLPTRNPGDTGELDPNTLPDWLRTGDTIAGQVQSPFAQESNTKPLTLEDLTNQGATGDLPDWLIHEGDTSSELFEPPKDITTEAYLEMIGQDPSQLVSDEAREMAASANLPDWLTDVVGTDLNLTPASEEHDTETPDAGLLLTNVPDWLAELNDSDPQYQAAPASEEEEDVDLSQPAESGWLNQTDDDDFAWLDDTESSSAGTTDSFTSLFGALDDSPSEPDASLNLEEDLSWLGEPDTPTQDSATQETSDGFTSLFGDTSNNDEASLEEDFSWLENSSEQADSTTDNFTNLFADFEPESSSEPASDSINETEQETTGSDLESWFDFAEDNAQNTPEEAVPDWLNELGQPETNLFTSEEAFASKPAWEEADPEPEDISLEALFGDAEVSEETADNPLADWLNELDPQSTAVQTEGEAVPDWLTDIEEPETLTADDLLQTEGQIGEAFISAEPASNEPEDIAENALDWLVNEDDSSAVEPSGLTDWLTANEADEQPIENSAEPDWLGELSDSTNTPTEEEGIPDWLLDNQSTQSNVITNTEDDIPDWLLGAADASPSPSTTPAQQSETPDDDFSWMEESSSTSTDSPSLDDFPFLDDLPADDLSSDTISANLNEDMPDWLTSLSLSGETTPTDPDDGDLSGFTGLLQDKADSEANSTDSDSMSQMVQDDMPSWLGSLETDSGLRTSDVPDWLSDMGSEPSLDSEPSVTDDLVDDLLGGRGYDATSTLDWLSVADEVPSFDEEDVVEEETGVSPPIDQPLLADLETDSTSIGMFPDWLSAIDDELFEDVSISTDELPTLEEEPPSVEEPVVEEPDPQPQALLPEDPFSDDFQLDQGELPEWFSQLGEIEEKPSEPSKNLAINESVPDWLSDMRRNQEDTEGSSLSGLTNIEDLPGRLEEIPAELAGADLPDWLQADDLAQLTIAPGTTQEFPDWLQQIEKERFADDNSLLDLGEQPAAPSDWLEELPPSRDPREELVRSELPDWVAALKPQGTGDTQQMQTPHGEKVKQGPLSGVQGAIAIQEIVTLPRAAVKPISTFTITPEQEQQANLLRQLQRQEMSTAVATDAQARTHLSRRLVFALLLLAAIVLGTIVGNNSNLIRVKEASPALANTYHQIENVAGQTVLVAFDYTPTMAGELNESADILLNQLNINNNEILTLSGYATGSSIAETLTTDFDTQNLGYIPAEAVGLRQLAECLNNGCEQLYGRTPTIPLEDIALIVVLTGEQDNLLNWLEQVQASTELPLVVSVPQSLAPIARIYSQSGQLAGLIDGATAAYTYQETYNITADTHLPATLTGQLFAQLIIGLIAIVTVSSAILKQRREN